jgi:ureidoglycolate hydrolase
MSQVIEIKVEALTNEAFAPLGQLGGLRLEYNADGAT